MDEVECLGSDESVHFRKGQGEVLYVDVDSQAWGWRVGREIEVETANDRGCLVQSPLAILHESVQGFQGDSVTPHPYFSFLSHFEAVFTQRVPKLVPETGYHGIRLEDGIFEDGCLFGPSDFHMPNCNNFYRGIVLYDQAETSSRKSAMYSSGSCPV